MKKRLGFTLVELLVVIAILAVLGTVSIVGYTSFTKKANFSDDSTLVTEWNKLLDGKDILAESNENERIDNVIEAKDLFKENGSLTKDFTPRSSGYHFYWNLEDNRTYLVDDSTSNLEIKYPLDQSSSLDKDMVYILSSEYCLLKGEIEGLTFSRNALVVGEENTIKVSGDSIPAKIKIGDSILNVDSTTHEIKLTPSSALPLELSGDASIHVQSISIADTSSINVGDYIILQYIISPSDADNQNVTWSSEDETIATVAENGTVHGVKEGTTTITVTTVDGSKTDTCSVTVSKKNPNLTTIPQPVSNLTYTGSPQDLITAGQTSGGELQYKLGSDGTYSTSIPKATNANTYTVYYKVVGNGTYSDVAEASLNVTISKAKVTKPTADATNFTYTGSSQTYTLTTNEAYTISNNSKTDAGTSEVTVSLKDKANYEWADGSTTDLKFNFIINKATQTISAPTATTENIEATSVTLTAISSGHGKTYYAKNTSNSAPSTGWQESTSFTGLSASTDYYFFAKYEGDTNYNGATSTGTKITTLEEWKPLKATVAGSNVTYFPVLGGTNPQPNEFAYSTDGTNFTKVTKPSGGYTFDTVFNGSLKLNHYARNGQLYYRGGAVNTVRAVSKVSWYDTFDKDGSISSKIDSTNENVQILVSQGQGGQPGITPGINDVTLNDIYTAYDSAFCYDGVNFWSKRTEGSNNAYYWSCYNKNWDLFVKTRTSEVNALISRTFS